MWNQLLRESFRHERCGNRCNRHRSRNRDSWRGRGWACNLDFSAVINRGEGAGCSRIEPLPGKVVNNLQRVYGVVGLLIRTVCCERIESVSDGDDARQKWNLISLQPVRI